MFAFGEKGGEWFWGGVQRDFNFIRKLNSSIKKKNRPEADMAKC